MHNLYPAVGEINERRGHLPVGLVAGEPRRLGSCDLEIAEDTIEPRPEARGDIARAYLYMHDRYENVALDAEFSTLLVSWHERDAPDTSEKARNDFIERAQGNRNGWIDK